MPRIETEAAIVKGLQIPNMAKKIENAQSTEKISRAQLLGYKVDATEFDKMGGETFAGLRILKLEPGEAAGPFKLASILKNQQLNKKIKNPVDVYVATAADGKEIRMPAAAGFTAKAKDSELSVGDTFFVKRVEDYVSKAYGNKGQGYELKITSRAK